MPEVTYLTTSFEDDFYTRTAVDYNAGNARLSFFVSKIRGKFKFKAGAKGVYGIGNEFDGLPSLSTQNWPFLSATERKFAPFLNISGSLKQTALGRSHMKTPT